MSHDDPHSAAHTASRTEPAPRPLASWQASLLVLALLASAAGGLTQLLAEDEAEPSPAVAASAAEALVLVHAQPFVLSAPYVSEWSAEAPLVRSGWLVVLRGDPARFAPRQAAEPVLFVGDTPAERINLGGASGHVVAIVRAAPAGRALPDLATLPAFQGAAELPERVTSAMAAAELLAARARGLSGPGAASLAAVTAPTLQLPSRDELYDAATTLIERFAPDERDLISGLRAPRLPR